MEWLPALWNALDHPQWQQMFLLEEQWWMEAVASTRTWCSIGKKKKKTAPEGDVGMVCRFHCNVSIQEMNLLKIQFVKSLLLHSRLFFNTSFMCLNRKASVLLTQLYLLHLMLICFIYLKVNMSLCAPRCVRQKTWNQVKPLKLPGYREIGVEFWRHRG